MNNLQTLKAEHELAMNNYAQQAKEYIGKHGEEQLSFLGMYLISVETYSRGAYNTLNELERMEK